MKCPSCGAETSEGAYYCRKCGRDLRGVSFSFIGFNNKFTRKYGTGWVVLVLIYFLPTMRAEVNTDDIFILYEMFFSLIISLMLYFLFRQKLLTGIKRIWARSFVSGILAFIIVGFIRLTILFIQLQS